MSALVSALDERVQELRASAWITLDLPIPPSVNRFVAKLGNKSPKVTAWVKQCDGLLMTMRPRPKQILGEFEATITWDDKHFADYDVDNRIKPLLDWLQRIELIENDKWCRRLIVGWGATRAGCIVDLRAWRP